MARMAQELRKGDIIRVEALDENDKPHSYFKLRVISFTKGSDSEQEETDRAGKRK